MNWFARHVGIVEYLADESTRSLVLTPLAVGAPVVAMCAVLSVVVVVKRLAFVGQGVAHCAFGGVGVAAMVAATTGAVWAGQGSPFETAVVVVFCMLCALGMAAVADRRAVREDTGIGLFLVGSMAAGAVMVEVARTLALRLGHPTGTRSWESLLFGSVMVAAPGEIWLAAGVAGGVLAAAWLMRRPLLFYVFDETAAPAFGVPHRVVRGALMLLLAVATVVAMRVTGIVLSSALLVLPGAIGLKLSTRLAAVLGWAIASALGSLLIGVAAAVQFNVAAGPCVVLTMIILFVLALGVGAAGRARGARPTAGAGRPPPDGVGVGDSSAVAA